MDEIVRQAMAKWPNVPHCYGWLALDARGGWRMRDERAQALGLPGDRIRNAALLAFINRNYMHDAQGRWYFQNGPQRVYVNLEATPYIAHTDPERELVFHTGEALDSLDAAWMTDDGSLLLKSGERLALLDDRDLAQCLSKLRMNGAVASDEDILKWLERPEAQVLAFSWQGATLPLSYMKSADIASRFGFAPNPQPDAA